jgi:YVTN family beta-propeller protein
LLGYIGMGKRTIFLKLGILSTLLIVGCSGLSNDKESGNIVPGFPGAAGTSGYGDLATSGLGGGAKTAGESAGNASAMDGGVPVLAPEKEKRVDFEQPKAGKRFVFVANTEADTVSVIDANNFSVTKVPAGDKPTFVTTVPSDKEGVDIAMVLNVGSDDATIIRAQADKDPEANNLGVVINSNVISVSPDGKFAVVYYNSDYSSAGDSSGSYQDVTVISFSEQKDIAIDMTVGFRPTAVSFSSDGSKGFVVTDDGVSILDFAKIVKDGASVAETVSLGYSQNTIPTDVSVTADGSYALAYLENSAIVRLVNLDPNEGKQRDLDLELGKIVTSGSAESTTETAVDAGVDKQTVTSAITDLDLSPQGDFAVAVLRDKNTVFKIPIPQAFDDPKKIESTKIKDVLFGSSELAADGRTALLYTTLRDDQLNDLTNKQLNKQITIFDLDKKEETRTVQLRKSIDSVTISPDSENALIIHQKSDGSADELGIDDNTRIARSYGYSILKLSTGFPKLEVTQTQPESPVITPDSDYLFILFRDDSHGIKEVHRISLKSLHVDVFAMKGPPYSMGEVPQSEKVFVAQKQTGGLITLIPWNSDDTRDVTGFDRNPRVKSW